MKKMVCFLSVLALLAFVGCKDEQAAAQKTVVKDTTKVVAPAKVDTAKAAPAAAVKPAADTVKTKKK